MQFKKWAVSLTGALLLASTLSAANPTFFGGYEDTRGGDYDYNDIIFQISAPGLKLNSSGTWNEAPVLGTSGTPFWNNASLDGANANVGYRIYGGGSLGAGLDPSAKYLAGAAGESVSDVFFSFGPVASSVTTVGADIDLKISAHNNELGYFYLTDPATVNWFASGAGQSYSFTDVGAKAFGIAARDLVTGDVFYSTGYGTQDAGINHIAWFAEAPEPATWAFLGLGLIAAGAVARKRNKGEVAVN